MAIVNVLIWGAGAIGGTIGAYLIRAGHEVLFVDTDEVHVRTLNEDGLEITGPIETFSVPAQARTPKTLSGTYSAILLCVKAHHTAAATQTLAPFLAPDGYVVSVQNGLNEEEIAQQLGRERVLGAFVNFGADYLEPGVVHFGGRGAVVLGELDGRMTSRLKALHDLFLAFDKQAITTPNIMGYLWGKLAYGAILFATALTNLSIADALEEPRYAPLFAEIAREVMRVAEAEGIHPEGFNGFNPSAFTPAASETESTKSIVDMVAFNRKSAKTHSGIWRDLAVRKRPTEVDAQLGAVVRHGKAHEIDTHLNGDVIRLIHDIESGQRELGLSNLDLLLDSLTAGRPT